MELPEITSLELTSESLRRVVALTGAGISAESGIPTFRGADGFWKRYRPEDLATPEAFARDPRLVWEWYLFRRQLIAEAKPNAGHYALFELEKMLDGQFTLITQNVDGLHQRAGNLKPIQLHGSIFVNRCSSCSKHSPDDELDFDNLPPNCPHCGGSMRPGVVWFGESLNISVVEDAFSCSRQATLFLAIGTSAVVHPAASLPLAAHENGAFLIEINPESTPISSVADCVLRYPSARALPLLVDEMRGVQSPVV